MPRYSSDKDINTKVKLLIRAGWRYKRLKKHGLLTAPDGGRVVVSTTPSCRRSFRNFCSQLTPYTGTAHARD